MSQGNVQNGCGPRMPIVSHYSNWAGTSHGDVSKARMDLGELVGRRIRLRIPGGVA